MRNPLTPPEQAYTPDADRAGPDLLTHRPDWFVQCLARLILFLLQHLLASWSPRGSRMPSWWQDRPDLPAGSAQAEAAAIRGAFGNSIAWMCRRHGIGPGHRDWPELSHAIVAFGGSLKGFDFSAPAWGLQWWENPNVVPGMIGVTVATPAAAASASLPARQPVPATPPPAPDAVAAEARHARSLASWFAAAGRQGSARLGTGPPTGPPAAWAGCPGPPILPCIMHGARARLAPPY
jgi:hypothetical protein